MRGYDIQGPLYRAMLESGGFKDTTDKTLRNKVHVAKQKGVTYYMLNDQVSLSDSEPTHCGAVPGWQTLKDDLSINAVSSD